MLKKMKGTKVQTLSKRAFILYKVHKACIRRLHIEYVTQISVREHQACICPTVKNLFHDKPGHSFF